jgi:hypothetical protein
MHITVGAGQNHLVVGEEDRVVPNAVRLDLDLLARPPHLVADGAEHLWRRTHAVRILDLDLLLAGEEI